METKRRIGLFGATSIGIGAIVGGGILALAGTAFVETGAGAILALFFNGLIALATALSFAELATAYPHSGGTYLFAKRVLPVGAAFYIGWIVWFASIVAGVLYALGFAAFLVGGIESAFGSQTPAFLSHPSAVAILAGLAALGCAVIVARSTRDSGALINVGKVLVFAILIGGGLWMWLKSRTPILPAFTPLMPNGTLGLLRAMGFTFIILQGFDLIATVSGEIKEPRKNLPRAIFLSLAIALGVYIPLMVIVLVLGIPEGSSVVQFAADNPDTLLAQAAGNYLGASGFWLVVVAGVLSMFSALLANLYAASRIAQAMAHDRTLPSRFARVHDRLGTPVMAVAVTTGLCLLILAFVRDVASAGAASSLIFLLSFALTNALCVVMRRRMPKHGGFRVPFWPWLPILAALACGSLAIFQSAVVPEAGVVVASWLLLGGFFYVVVFGRLARVQDAIAEVEDVDLLELRGRSPLVLVPTDRSTNAGVLALFAACITPTRAGRVLLLNILSPFREQVPDAFDEHLEHASHQLRDSLRAAVQAGARTEWLATVGLDRLTEIERVARTHRCAAVLLGMHELSDADLRGSLEKLATQLVCDVLLLRIPTNWRPENVHRVLAPIRGSAAHSTLRARLLASLRHRASPDMEIVYLLVLPSSTTEHEMTRRVRAYTAEMQIETSIPSVVRAVLSDDVAEAIVQAAAESDLLVLGLTRAARGQRAFSEITRKIIASTECPALVLSQRG